MLCKQHSSSYPALRGIPVDTHATLANEDLEAVTTMLQDVANDGGVRLGTLGELTDFCAPRRAGIREKSSFHTHKPP